VLEAGDRRNACMIRSYMACAAIELGAYARAEAAMREVLADAMRMGLSPATGAATELLSAVLARQGSLDEAAAMSETAVQIHQASGNTRALGSSLLYRAEIRLAAGDIAGALLDGSDSVAMLSSWPPLHAYALARKATVLIAAQRADEAIAPAREAF